MRISRVQAFLCDAGWRPWTFVKVETDDGLVGWGECSDSRNPSGVVGCVRDFEELLIGEDPRAIQRLYWDMIPARVRSTVRSARPAACRFRCANGSASSGWLIFKSMQPAMTSLVASLASSCLAVRLRLAEAFLSAVA